MHWSSQSCQQNVWWNHIKKPLICTYNSLIHWASESSLFGEFGINKEEEVHSWAQCLFCFVLIHKLPFIKTGFISLCPHSYQTDLQSVPHWKDLYLYFLIVVDDSLTHAHLFPGHHRCPAISGYLKLIPFCSSQLRPLNGHVWRDKVLTDRPALWCVISVSRRRRRAHLWSAGWTAVCPARRAQRRSPPARPRARRSPMRTKRTGVWTSTWATRTAGTSLWSLVGLWCTHGAIFTRLLSTS